MGANLGDREATLRTAVLATPDVVAVSPLYETDPVGGPPGQDPYLNLVVVLDTDLDPRELLEVCRRLEQAAGRERTVRWGPRTLDVDVLLVGDCSVADDDLVVPHPRLWERGFVVAPLLDVAPDLVPPGARERAGGHVRRVGMLVLS
jgi:2-amino-4-hydroxy-6-hydroxymethyldihydropteridine diphosphokinase